MPLCFEDHYLVLLVLALLYALHQLITVIGFPTTKEFSESLLSSDSSHLLCRHLLLPGPILLSHLLITVATTRLLTNGTSFSLVSC